MLSLVLAVALAGCPSDCSKVLVSKQEEHREAVKSTITDIKEESKQDIEVSANVEDSNGYVSSVECSVNGEELICEW